MVKADPAKTKGSGLMALSTYAELQASVADFLNRQDLTSAIPDFIRLAEAQMQRDVRHYSMEARTSLAVSGRYTALPDGFLEPISLYMAGANNALRPITQDEMQHKRYRSSDASGTECYYCITAGEIEIFPTPTSNTLELYYIGEIAPLADDNTSNWLLAAAPDVYLNGALSQSAPYLKDDERLIVWTTLYTNAVNALNRASERAKWGGQGLSMRTKRNG